MDFKHLKSGTDLRGKAIGSDAVLTSETALILGFAFAGWLKQRSTVTSLRIAIGRDSRLSGSQLLFAFAQGAAKAGATVLDFGLCTTPAMYQSLKDTSLNLAASVMVTASHHPADRNGLKFFTKKDGGFSSQLLADFVTYAEHIPKDLPDRGTKGEVIAANYLKTYCDALKAKVRKELDTNVARPLLGLHIVVDAGNGAGGFYAQLLDELGAWTEGSQFLKPDGTFPNHAPNPENEAAMQSISQAVIAAEADLGVIFDADCDRAAIVDAQGNAINRNRLIALVSAMLLDKLPGITIVTDSVTSSGLARFIGEWGGEHYRYKRGYRNVIDEAIRLNRSGVNCPLAIETSGHAAFRDNDFVDDGMYLSTVLICEAMRLKKEGKSLFSLISGLEEPVESVEIRLPITAKDYHPAGLRLIEKVMEHATFDDKWEIASDNREGIRIGFDLGGEMDSGWFLLRMSVHDPVLALNVESDVEGGVKYMINELYAVIRDAQDIDLSNLESYENPQEE